MSRKLTARRFYQVSTAMSLVLLTAGCATNLLGNRPTPDYDDNAKRARMLVRYCEKLTKTGDLTVAASICQRAYETNPSDPTPLYNLAAIYRELGAVEEAGNVYRRVLLMNPDDFEALYGLAKTSIDLGKYAEAESQLERALQIDDGDPRVYNALGIVKDQKGEHEVAQALYRTGLLIDSANVPLRNNLGLSLALSGEQDQSIEMLRDVAGEPGAGTVSSQNLALASTYKAPIKAGPDDNGPIEIRTPEDMAAGPDAFTEGDADASAMAKPLHKKPGRPAPTMAQTEDGEPKPLGTASASVESDRRHPGMDVGAAIPTEFLASNDHAPETSAAPKATAEPTKRRKTVKVSGPKEYRVQVGAFRKRAGADRAWKIFTAKSDGLLGGLDHWITKADTGTPVGTVYRLRAGPLENRAASDELCAKLRSRSLGCFVVEIPKAQAMAPAAMEPEQKPLNAAQEKNPAAETPAAKGAESETLQLLPAEESEEPEASSDPATSKG